MLLLLMPPKEFELDLRLLSGMARLLTQDAVRRGLLETEDTAAVMATLEAAERVINAPGSSRGSTRAPGGDDGPEPAKG